MSIIFLKTSSVIIDASSITSNAGGLSNNGTFKPTWNLVVYVSLSLIPFIPSKPAILKNFFPLVSSPKLFFITPLAL
jgi:hypothetical protein